MLLFGFSNALRLHQTESGFIHLSNPYVGSDVAQGRVTNSMDAGEVGNGVKGSLSRAIPVDPPSEDGPDSGQQRELSRASPVQIDLNQRLPFTFSNGREPPNC